MLSDDYVRACKTIDKLQAEHQRLRAETSAIIDTQAAYIKSAEAERDHARAEHQRLREALTAIQATARGDEKGECWTIRAYLDKHDVFNDDLQSETRLIEEACKFALGVPPVERFQSRSVFYNSVVNVSAPPIKSLTLLEIEPK